LGTNFMLELQEYAGWGGEIGAAAVKNLLCYGSRRFS
jgi:hypothetical protein